MIKKELLKTALLTSPLLAIYGVAPVIIYNVIDINKVLVGFSSLAILMFIFWLINIYLIDICKQVSTRYFFSYSGTLIFHSLIIFYIPRLLKHPAPLNNLIYAFISTLAINTIILVIINSIIIKREKDFTESENQKLKVTNLEAQKKILLSQLHPHFLFNALSILKSLISDKPEEAEDYVVKLSEFLRYSVQAHTNELVPLQEELQFTRDYLDLQKVRFGNSFSCIIEIPETVLHLKLPAFALQAVVENALKHNALTTKQPLFINITLDKNRVKIVNNKISKPLIIKSGTGLRNLNDRYKLVSGREIEIVSTDKEFTVILNLLEK